MSLPADQILLATLQWHPRFGGIWCGVIVLAAAVWLYYLQRRIHRDTEEQSTAPQTVSKYHTTSNIIHSSSDTEDSQAFVSAMQRYGVTNRYVLTKKRSVVTERTVVTKRHIAIVLSHRG
jgi:hypothetical protein